MSVRHAAVWIDHNEAKVFHVDGEAADAKVIGAPHHHLHRHPKGPSEKKDHPADAKHFFEQVARALADAEEILIVGPAAEKIEFVKHLDAHEHAIKAKVLGVETVDHPTDGQLVAHIRKYFRAADRMRGTRP